MRHLRQWPGTFRGPRDHRCAPGDWWFARRGLQRGRARLVHRQLPGNPEPGQTSPMHPPASRRSVVERIPSLEAPPGSSTPSRDRIARRSRRTDAQPTPATPAGSDTPRDACRASRTQLPEDRLDPAESSHPTPATPPGSSSWMRLTGPLGSSRQSRVSGRHRQAPFARGLAVFLGKTGFCGADMVGPRSFPTFDPRPPARHPSSDLRVLASKRPAARQQTLRSTL